MTAYQEIIACEVCGSTALTEVLNLGLHPMCDDLIPIGESLQAARYPITILYCVTCHTAHQKYQVPKRCLFPQEYHYRSRLTGDVLGGMDDLVESVQAVVGPLDELLTVDIGCNDGSLLDKFANKGSFTIGVEPTGAAFDANGRNHIVINDYFGPEVAWQIRNEHGQADIITFTNVFAHIENLPLLLDAIKILASDQTMLVIENHYLGSVLKHNQFDTFYHEHPRTYSLGSFRYIAAALGMDIVKLEFPKRYGGNIRVFMAKSGPSSQHEITAYGEGQNYESNFVEAFANMRSFISLWKDSKRHELRSLIAAEGKLIAKAFPGRAAILITLLGLTGQEIECVYEKPGSPKIGHYVPGTDIPIRSDYELFARTTEIKSIVNLAWHIPAEIETYLRGGGFGGKIINIV